MSDFDKYNDLLNHNSDEEKDEFAQFLKKSSDAKVPSKQSKEDIWSRIEKEIDEDPAKKTVPLWTYIGIAASILLVATFIFYPKSDPLIITTSTVLAESRVIELPDGSTASLNANTTISYSEDWDRELTLKGEAFFEVTEGEKFLVKTSIGDVEVLGTSFNVFVRDSVFEVACKTGKVGVSIPTKEYNQPLAPGEVIRLESDTVKRTTLTTDLVGKWKLGEFYFNEQLLSNVLREMERQFDVSLSVADSSDIEFSGYFTNKNIEDALDMVCLPLGLTYEKVSLKKYAIKEIE